MNKILLMLKKSRMKSPMSSLRRNLVTHLKMKFVQFINFQPPTDISAIPKTSRTNLKLPNPNWDSMLMMNFLQKVARSKTIMHLLIIFILTLQLVHVMIPLHWCLNLFPLHFQPNLFRRLIGFHQKKFSLRKNTSLNIS